MNLMKQISQAWQEFLALPRKNKLGVGVLLFVLFFFSFLATTYYWRIITPRPKLLPSLPFVKKPLVNKASLSLAPQSQTLKAGQTFWVSINLKTGDYKVDTVDVVLNFDPNLLAVEEISPGMFFADYPVKKIEKGKIILTGTIGAEEKQVGGVKGEGSTGSLKFRVLSSGSTQVNFDKASLVASKGENVLGETKGAKFEIY